MEKFCKQFLLVGGALILVLSPALARAESLGDVASQLNNQNRKAAEVSDHIASVDDQIQQIQGQIDDTQAKIADTNAAIADAKDQMAGQQTILAQYVQQQYKQSGTTALEMLVESSSISQFLDKEQYVEAGRDKVTKAVEQIVAIKKELDTKSAQLTKLNAQLTSAENGLAYEKAQAEDELAGIEAAQADLKAKLAKYSGGRVVQVGDVVQVGQLIGFEGTSGCSTGPHLHFEVDQYGTPVNPRNFLGSSMRWPVDDGFGINQEFGKPNWAAPYAFHTGIDIAKYYGAPVYAAKTGTVIFSGYDRSGFGDHVIIDHGGGLTTIYGHLGARASDYPNC